MTKLYFGAFDGNLGHAPSHHLKVENARGEVLSLMSSSSFPVPTLGRWTAGNVNLMDFDYAPEAEDLLRALAEHLGYEITPKIDYLPREISSVAIRRRLAFTPRINDQHDYIAIEIFAMPHEDGNDYYAYALESSDDAMALIGKYKQGPATNLFVIGMASYLDFDA